MKEDNAAKRRRNPMTWIPSVYFAMGFPFVILNMVAVLMFKGLNISDSQIALWTSLIMIPWTLKPLWSPLLGMYRTKKFFVVLTQLLTGCMFGLVALVLNMPHFFAITVGLLAIIAFSGATHDVATDGVYIDELSPEDQAKYIGWQGAFYNLAKLVATGGLVYLAGYMISYFSRKYDGESAIVYAWMSVMLLCGVVMILLGIYHTKMLPSGKKASGDNKSLKESMTELWSVFKDFFTKKHIVWYICFIILYRFAEGFVVKIVPLFLKAPVEQQGLGLSEQEIGVYYGTFGAAAFVLGSILAGYYISAKGLRNVLFRLCCCFNIPFLVYMFLAYYQPTNGILIATAIIFEYFGYGFGFAGLILFMMQQVAAGKHQMAHYAFASGIMNLGIMIPGMISGFISDWIGYKYFFVFTVFAMIPSFLVAYFVPFTYNDKGEKLED
ncbi:MFS transporter [Parabacteroides bouchesdurhonensis]|uniref:MFS transporter n=1 Tax=Parabacteroides bouchesdurhonensis TaxID=1936995 RepID=UPI000C8433D6|nr:MFS transporter [Parabacteroides bouchesdurhonensis]RHJ91715.1 MFS transporter [Bacteroides sp. AM07-16]